MHVDENRVHNYTFATKLSAAGYKVSTRNRLHLILVPVAKTNARVQVGIFGKYLNSHDLPEQTAVDPGLVPCHVRCNILLVQLGSGLNLLCRV